MAERLDHRLAHTAARALADVAMTDDLRSRLTGLPVLLRTSGIAATCAFLLSKADDAAYKTTATILLTEAGDAAGVDIPRGASGPEQLRRLTEFTEQQYLLAETRALLLATWLSRFARASKGA